MITNPFSSAAVARVNSMEFLQVMGDIYEVIADNLAKSEMDEEEILEVVSDNIIEPQIPKYYQIGEGKIWWLFNWRPFRIL